MPEEDAERLLDWLEDATVVASDPENAPPVQSPDPGDDYLLALAAAQRAMLVSGGEHLLALGEDLPILTPRRFLELLDRRD